MKLTTKGDIYTCLQAFTDSAALVTAQGGAHQMRAELYSSLCRKVG